MNEVFGFESSTDTRTDFKKMSGLLFADHKYDGVDKFVTKLFRLVVFPGSLQPVSFLIRPACPEEVDCIIISERIHLLCGPTVAGYDIQAVFAMYVNGPWDEKDCATLEWFKEEMIRHHTHCCLRTSEVNMWRIGARLVVPKITGLGVVIGVLRQLWWDFVGGKISWSSVFG